MSSGRWLFLLSIIAAGAALMVPRISGASVERVSSSDLTGILVSGEVTGFSGSSSLQTDLTTGSTGGPSNLGTPALSAVSSLAGSNVAPTRPQNTTSPRASVQQGVSLPAPLMPGSTKPRPGAPTSVLNNPIPSSNKGLVR